MAFDHTCPISNSQGSLSSNPLDIGLPSGCRSPHSVHTFNRSPYPVATYLTFLAFALFHLFTCCLAFYEFLEVSLPSPVAFLLRRGNVHESVGAQVRVHVLQRLKDRRMRLNYMAKGTVIHEQDRANMLSKSLHVFGFNGIFANEAALRHIFGRFGSVDYVRCATPHYRSHDLRVTFADAQRPRRERHCHIVQVSLLGSGDVRGPKNSEKSHRRAQTN